MVVGCWKQDARYLQQEILEFKTVLVLTYIVSVNCTFNIKQCPW
jgi:hypothetical protein